MTLQPRDKKILAGLIPVVLLVAFWMLILSPKRAEVAKLGDDVARAQQSRDDAVTKAGSLERSRETYASDYATVVRLGKAVPTSVDMPSLLVQLDAASKGTKIRFAGIKAGDRTVAPGVTASATPPSGSNSPPVAAGGAQAQTGPGQSTEKANNASATAGQANANAQAQPQASGSPTTGGAAGASGSSPAPGAAAGSAGAATSSGSGVQGLDSVPLDFTFTGSYFDLADFFHEMKRFVRVAGGDVRVKGRLMTVDRLTFDSTDFPKIKATVKATAYLSPKAEGTTAGGTSSGPTPTGTPTAGSGSTPAPTPTSSGGTPQ